MTSEIGRDGFSFSSVHPRAAAHAWLNGYIASEDDPTPAVFTATLRKLKKDPSPRASLDVLIAALERMVWLRQYESDIAGAHQSIRRFRVLLAPLYKQKLPFTEPDLRAVVQSTTLLQGLIGPSGPVEQVLEFLKQNDLTPGLCKDL